MALTNLATGAGLTQAAGAFTPEDLGSLIVTALKGQSIAAQSATVTGTDRDKVLFPKFAANPDVAHYSELDLIALGDPETDEVEALIYKTAGATRQSRELVADSTPNTADLVGAALAEQIIRAVDGAYLAATTPKGPGGLLGTGYTSVDTGASLTNLDAFVSAKYAALANRGEITNWIISPTVAEQVSQLKVGSGSNQNLLQFVENGMMIAGVPVLISDQVDAATKFWGISKARTVLVIREGTKVERSTESAFLNDAVDLKATFRYGLGFLHEPANVRGYDAV
ncbi:MULTISPECIES: phage major capsid protein [Rhodococcus]|uniref:phage major capsid protein n=1 Tax=Rhodococcus TaxID=1827 RepID=UPI000B2FC017|nr:phage major capsid protein [Rhodococcus globerulus]